MYLFFKIVEIEYKTSKFIPNVVDDSIINWNAGRTKSLKNLLNNMFLNSLSLSFAKRNKKSFNFMRVVKKLNTS